jgi:hypothetical protein
VSLPLKKPLQQVEHTLHDLTSPKRGHTFWGLVGTLLVCAALLWVAHRSWLHQPNEQMLSETADGLKNYMTSAWHVRHDSTYWAYHGMNYPYGEHVLFTDNQPIFSAAMQWWSRHVSDLSEWSVGAMNLFQVVSLLLGCGFVFLLFRKLHLAVWYAGAVALGLTFLAPQYNRFDAHFGLSHTFVIPAMLFLLCRYEERTSRRYQSLQIGIWVWLTAQLHFYYFGMAALFLTLYIGFQILRQFSWGNIRRRLSHWVVMVIVPFVALNFWIHWTHYTPDRPASPYGFTTYIGYWEGVFLPYEQSPLFRFLDEKIIHIRRINFEAQAYAGITALFFTLWWLFSGFRMFGRSWDEAAYHRVHKHYLRGLFFAAFLLLLFSCGFPFAIKGMDWMVNYMGPLRQFRGLGRFTWPFFYVINLLIFYGAWNWSRRYTGRGSRWMRPAILFVPLALVAWEAFIFQKNKPIGKQHNVARTDVVTADPNHWTRRVDYRPFQALLPLPYYHMGSENIWLDFDGDHFRRVQATALYTGKPDMGVNMSRTSARETVRSVQLGLEPGEVPAILADLPDERPLALLIHPSAWPEVQRRYPHLIKKSQLLYEHNDLKIMRLELDSIRAAVREHARSVASDMAARTLHPIAGTPWRSTQTQRDFVHLTFDSLSQAPHQFRGSGALSGQMGDTSILWQGVLPKGTYTFSCWLRAAQDLGMCNELKIIENSLSDGHEIHLKHEGLQHYLRMIVGEWALVELGFEVYEGQRVTFMLQKKGADATFLADEVLIKPINTEVFRREPGWVVRNNYWYRTQ